MSIDSSWKLALWINVLLASMLVRAYGQAAPPRPPMPRPPAAPGGGPEAQVEVAQTNAEATPVPVALPSDLRDPFWPVGFSPVVAPGSSASNVAPSKVVAPRVPQWDDARKEITIKGIMKTGAGRFLAVLNGQVVSENDVVTVTLEGQRYRWRVASIGERSVSLKALDVAVLP